MLGTSWTRKKANQTGAQEAPSSIVEGAEIPSKGKVKTAHWMIHPNFKNRTGSRQILEPVRASAKLPDLDQNCSASKVAIRSIPKPAAELDLRKSSMSVPSDLAVGKLGRSCARGNFLAAKRISYSLLGVWRALA
ncbi:hypothetical protein ACEPAH_3393 [Sanghuangporus vaninii]